MCAHFLHDNVFSLSPISISIKNVYAIDYMILIFYHSPLTLSSQKMLSMEKTSSVRTLLVATVESSFGTVPIVWPQ